MSSAECCTFGEPAADGYKVKGHFSRIGELPVYVAEPIQNDTSQEVVLLLPDGFGHATHNLLLADLFSEKGWRTIVPDYFEGDAIPVSEMKRNREGRPSDFDLGKWLSRHPHDRVERLLKGLVTAIKLTAENTQFCVVGYCFGGKHAFILGKTKSVKAVASFHPMFVTREDLKNIHVPLCVGLAEKDEMIPAAFEQDLQAWTTADKTKISLEVYPGMGHGFAARPDTDDPVMREQYERAFNTTVSFFRQADNA